MPHVLIHGDTRYLTEVRGWLRTWGLTLGVLPEDAQLRGQVSRSECDAVLYLCDESGEPSDSQPCDPAPVDTGTGCGAADDSPAPLLVVGTGPRAEVLGREALRTIPEPGPQGQWLRVALEECLAQPLNALSSAFEFGQDEQLHFLGHELRSPLTAIKTALEVIEGELWQDQQSGRVPVAESRLRMLEIALRNVRRMHRAVEWSQDLLQFESGRRSDESRTANLSGLCEGLRQLTGLPTEMRGDDHRIECDTDLLLHLGEQAAQAALVDDPETRADLSLEIEHEGLPRLILRLGRVVDRSESSAVEELRVHLQRFADFLNPCTTLRRAGVEVRVEAPGVGRLELVCAMDVIPHGEPALSSVG